MKIEALDMGFVRSILRYDQDSGEFVWINPPKNHPRLLGQKAGSPTEGQILIKIGGTKYGAHHLVWYLSGRSIPAGMQIDHRDGDPYNNRVGNLRLCVNATNQANKRRIAGKLLPKGVRIIPSGKFVARISFEKKQIVIGTFVSIAEAQAAYLARAKELYGEFARAA